MYVCTRARVHTHKHTYIHITNVLNVRRSKAAQGFVVHLNDKISIFALLVEFRFKMKTNIYRVDKYLRNASIIIIRELFKS